MGLMIKTICECGFESDNIFTGSGFMETPSWWAPAICLSCRKLLKADYEKKHARCPTCNKEVTFYDDSSELRKSITVKL